MECHHFPFNLLSGCVFVFRWLLNVTFVKRLSPCWTRQSSWFPLSSPWVSSCVCSGKGFAPVTGFRLCILSVIPFLHFSLSGVRLPWSPLRLCSSLWPRKACPACPPAWERFIPATETRTAFSTSPMPRRRCSELPQPGHPAEPAADQTTQLNCGPLVATRGTNQVRSNLVRSTTCMPSYLIVVIVSRPSRTDWWQVALSLIGEGKELLEFLRLFST